MPFSVCAHACVHHRLFVCLHVCCLLYSICVYVCVLHLSQAELETVIPALKKRVRIVNGIGRGQVSGRFVRTKRMDGFEHTQKRGA